MLNNEAQAASPSLLLAPASYASTFLASSNYVDTKDFEGDIMIVLTTGAGTGSYSGYLHHSNVTGASFGATISFNEGDFLPVLAASGNLVQKRTVRANSINRYIRNGGVIATGPFFVSVSVHGRKKDVT